MVELENPSPDGASLWNENETFLIQTVKTVLLSIIQFAKLNRENSQQPVL